MQRRHDPTYYWATRSLPARRPPRHARPLRLRAHGRRDRRRAAPAAEPEARRAALDAWEAELDRGLAPALAPPGRRGARRRRAPPRPAARRAAAPTCAPCASTAGRCGSRRGRSSRPTWTAPPAPSGASWRRCSASRAPPRGLRPPRARLPAHELHPRRARGHRPRPDLPAGGRARTLRRRRGATWRASHASPELRALLAFQVAPRARAVRRGGARRRRRAALGPDRRPARRRGLPPRARPRRARRLRRARPERRRPRPGSCRGAAVEALRR